MPELVTVWDAELGYTASALETRPPGGPATPTDPAMLGGAEPLWGIWALNSGGGTGVIVMPHSTLEWRSAEWGIDPDDLTTLMDVILHAGAVPDPADPMAAIDPAQAAVLEATRDLPTCWTPGVPDEDRRAAALERVKAVKQHLLRMDPAPRADRQGALDYVGSKRTAPADPLAPITQEARVDPIRVGAKRAFLDWHRESSQRIVTPNFELKPPSTFLSAAAVPPQ